MAPSRQEATQQRYNLVPALTLFLALLTTCHAQPTELVSASAATLMPRNTAVRCNAVCANSPYFIEPPVATALTPSITLICLRLRVRPGGGGICTNSRNPCCRQLATNLHEVLLLINSTCTPLISNVLLDGVRRDYAIATLNGSPTSTLTVRPRAALPGHITRSRDQLPTSVHTSHYSS
ncbi:hypothetical protein V8C86DRAFT_2641540 [Haematococcus lacustris]